MLNCKRYLIGFGWVGVMVLSANLQASGKVATPTDPGYAQECGSCHVAYPPRLLSASSWRALLGNLDHHFGVDANLDDHTLAAISRDLEGNARQREIAPEGRPVLRITETRWFRHEHDEVPETTWKLPAVKSPANCAACHTTAEQGNYSEHNIRIPR